MDPPRLVAGQHKTFVQSGDGLMWICEPGSHDGFGPLHAEQEPAGNSVHDFIMDLIKRRSEGVFMDIGAHVGHYTMRAAKLGARVIAVEANPEAAARLMENLRLNKLSEGVHIIAAALWDQPGLVHLGWGVNETDTPRAGGLRTLPYETGYQVDVPAITGDSLGISHLNVVKIDTEGADVRILRGLHETLVRCQPVVVVEDHSVYSYYGSEELDDEQARLTEAAGYEWKPIGDYGVEGAALNYRVGVVRL